jgi:hypothetical protein
VSAHGLRQVAWFDCPGGGQVRVEDGIAYLGHMRAPHGTTLLDVRDPRRPRVLSQLPIAPGAHSHKVRARDGIMLVNRERAGEPDPEFTPGLGIFDVSDPTRPRQIAHWPTIGRGVHRVDFDGRHAYLSSALEGFTGNIVVILDLADPRRPVEAAHFLPDPVDGETRVCANDVTVDARGLIYLYDRVRGLHILERC